MHELHSHLDIRPVLAPVVSGADDLTGAVIDLQGVGAVGIVVTLGTEGTTFNADIGIDVVVEHADEDPANPGQPDTFVPVTDAKQLFGARLREGELAEGVALQLRADAGGGVWHLGYKRDRRFLRVTLVSVGTHAGGGTPVAATAILLPLVRPAA